MRSIRRSKQTVSRGSSGSLRSFGKQVGFTDRPLRFESLETRRLLAVFTVTNLSDAPVAAPGDAPGTLRQALYDSNNNAEVDTINFGSWWILVGREVFWEVVLVENVMHEQTHRTLSPAVRFGYFLEGVGCLSFLGGESC